MIESVKITNLGVIGQAHLNLSDGLTAITGETGAGKTMAVTSLLLLLGEKANPARVRAGAEAAEVEGSFLIPENAPILHRITEAGGVYDVEDGQANVIIARTIPAKGRSRAYVGGRSVPTAVLRDIAQAFVTVHGQSDQIRLTGAVQQRAAVDSYGGKQISTAKTAWATAWESYVKARGELEKFHENMRDNAQKRLGYEALLAKVDAVAPAAGEEEELKQRAMDMENSAELLQAYSQAAALLSGSDYVEHPVGESLGNVVEYLRHAADILQAEEEKQRMNTLIERLEGAQAEIDDIAADISHAATATPSDPEELSLIYSRRQELAGLRKDLGMGIPEILQAAQEAREGLERLGDPETHAENLERHLAEKEEEMKTAGRKLYTLRKETAEKLSAAVNAELPSLSLPNATFHAEVTENEPSQTGMDNIQFLLASHSGAPMQALGVSASGGELSRVMLAIEVSLAAKLSDNGHTFLFDEIDSGIGGKAGTAIGQRLARLAKNAQVIVVTHLAQVAACATTQEVVEKNEDEENKSALTHVRTVSGEHRVEELARMLSGSESEAALTHAAELLSQANMAV